MTRTPPPKPQKPQPSRQPTPPSHENETTMNKPYRFVSFPQEKPPLLPPIGHHKYQPDRLHGTLFLTLNVQTPLHVSTGVAVMGSDIGNRIPLIKTMTQGVDQKLMIQGSSLKGCIRSVYEAITNSTLGVITSREKDKIPWERLPCKKKHELCAASQVFGALDWQGLIEFNDAKCEKTEFAVGFMPSLYSPRPKERRAYFDSRGKVVGRKFYYHTKGAIEKGQNQGIAVQQAAKNYTFITELQFKNLQASELGTLLIILGQDPDYPMALKIGGGKPIGMGTLTVTVTKISAFTDNSPLLQGLNLPRLQARYSSYVPPESDELTANHLQQFMAEMIKAAHTTHLVQATQLQELAEVLHYPTNREPPSGMY